MRNLMIYLAITLAGSAICSPAIAGSAGTADIEVDGVFTAQRGSARSGTADVEVDGVFTAQRGTRLGAACNTKTFPKNSKALVKGKKVAVECDPKTRKVTKVRKMIINQRLD